MVQAAWLVLALLAGIIVFLLWLLVLDVAGWLLWRFRRRELPWWLT